MCPPFLPHDSTVLSSSTRHARGLHSVLTDEPKEGGTLLSKAGKGRPWIKNTVYEWQGGQQGLSVLPSETQANSIAGLEW